MTAKGHTITFSNSVIKLTAGSSWATWSNGYTGSVYWNQSSSLKLKVSPGVSAFYLYGGATGFGFYSNTGEVKSLTVTTTDTAFGVGEFGVS